MSAPKQNRTVIGTDRLQEIRARLDGLSWVGDEFIAHAPVDIAWLLAELNAARERIALLRAEADDLERVTNERDIAQKWWHRWRRDAWEQRARRKAAA